MVIHLLMPFSPTTMMKSQKKKRETVASWLIETKQERETVVETVEGGVGVQWGQECLAGLINMEMGPTDWGVSCLRSWTWKRGREWRPLCVG